MHCICHHANHIYMYVYVGSGDMYFHVKHIAQVNVSIKHILKTIEMRYKVWGWKAYKVVGNWSMSQPDKGKKYVYIRVLCQY